MTEPAPVNLEKPAAFSFLNNEPVPDFDPAQDFDIPVFVRNR
jgi:hypothetical protein